MFCCSSLDTYLIKQSESFHWERAGSQVKISLTCVFTYTAGYQQSLQVCANAIYFYLPLRATQGPPPSRVLGEMCGGQLAKKPPRISLWIQMVFNSKASRKWFCEGGNFLFFFFFPPNNLCNFPHSSFARLAGLLPFILLWATQKTCTSARGQCLVGA